MRRYLRDIAIGLFCALVVALVVADVARADLTVTLIAAAAACAVAVAILEAPALVRRRREALKAAIVAELKALKPAKDKPHVASPAAILHAARAGWPTETAARLRELAGAARILQARLGEAQDREARLPAGVAPEIAQWEARALAELAGHPQARADFEAAPAIDPFTITAGHASDRLAAQIAVLSGLAASLAP